MKLLTQIALCSIAMVLSSTAQAEVVRESANHFTLRLEAQSELEPSEVWDRLIDPAQWWMDDHTYSGDAGNLTLDPVAGGLWLENWDEGSVWHGTVIQAHPDKSLILSAPFGPLQGLGVTSIWTISLTPQHGGTLIRFDHVTNGTEASELNEISLAVDYVKSQALESLARPLSD